MKKLCSKLMTTLTIAILLLLLCVTAGASSEYEVSNVETPIQVSLSIPTVPRLNEDAEVIYTISSVLDAPNTNAWLTLPEGAELVSGDLTWQGDLEAGKPISLPATIVFKETGDYAIEAVARHIITVADSWGDLDVIYLNVAADRGMPTIPSVGLPSKGEERAPSTPIKVELAISSIPAVNQSTELTCTVSSIRDAPDTTAQIILPEGAELVSGDLTWQGDLEADKPITFSATIVFKETGSYAIEAVARCEIVKANSWGDIDVSYMHVGVDRSTRGWPSIGPVSEIKQIRKGDVEPIAKPERAVPEEIPPVAPAVTTDGVVAVTTSHSSITVTGTFKYWTILGDYRSGTPDTLVPADTFLVELLDSSGSHVAYGYTDSTGYFSIPGVDPSGGIKARWWCYVKYWPYDYELRVVDSGDTLTGLDDVHRTVCTGVFYFADDGGTHSIGEWELPKGDTNDGAWWIKDDLDRAFRFTPTQPGPSTARWYATSTDGAYYFRGGQIHLEAVNERSPDTVVHEHGHNVMWNIYTNWNWPSYCPSPHYFDQSSHENCAWSEGWASFFALVVNGNPSYTWSGGSSLNLETPTWGTPHWDEGDDVEGRVTGALWDIYDTPNDGYDQFVDGFGNIWDTFCSSDDHTFAEYWGTWKSRGHNQVDAINSIYQNTIDYMDDAVAFRNGCWYVSKEDHTGTDWTKTFVYGVAGDIPVIGDIDNNGIVDAVIFRNGRWYVSKEDHTGTDWTKTFKYGIPGDKPVIGDIDNNGIVDAVIFRNGRWYVSKEDHTGTDWTKTFSYGVAGDKPVIGDIDNNGIVDAVIFRNGRWYVSKEDHTGTDWTKTFSYGVAGDIPVIGDIDNNGIVDAVIFRNGLWYVSKEDHTGTDWTKTFSYGVAGDKPVIGDIG